VGLPVAGKNQDNWGIMQPLLANPDLQPEPDDIEFSAALFQELLTIRDSSPLFRLQTAEDIQERVVFHNTGPSQLPGLIVMTISDLTDVDLDRNNEFVVVAVNANDEAQEFTDTDLVGLDLVLHPVQMHSVDDVVQTAVHNSTDGSLWIPGRTTAVFVVQATPSELIDFLIADVEALVEAGELHPHLGDWLIRSLDKAQFHLDHGRERPAQNQIRTFYYQVELLEWLHLLNHDDAESLKASAAEIYHLIR
jgi:hypothetical protein